jgi:hypothetical protein
MTDNVNPSSGNNHTQGFPTAFAQKGGIQGQHGRVGRLVNKMSDLSPKVAATVEKDTSPRFLQPDKQDDASQQEGHWKRSVMIGLAVLASICIGAGVGFALSGKNKNTSPSVTSTDHPADDACSLAYVEDICINALDFDMEDVPECIASQVDEIREILGTSLMLPVSENVDSCTAESLAVLKLAETYHKSELDALSILQRFVLNTMYYEMAGNEWIDDGGMFEQGDECDIELVSCNDKGEIESIAMELNKLRGTLPTTVGLLSSLSK